MTAMTPLTYRSVYAVQQRWGQTVHDLHDVERQLIDQPTAGLPTSVRAVAGIFLDTWAGYAAASAALASGFLLALSAADFVFRETDGFVAEQFTSIDGRLGESR